MANPFLVLGGIAISVATAAFGILQVPGWVASAQDAAAVNDIAQVSAAQAAVVSETGKYAASRAALDGQSGLTVTSSGGVWTFVAADATQKHHLVVARSASGAYFARTSSSADIGRGVNPEGAVIDTGATITGPAGARVTGDGVPVPTPDEFHSGQVVAKNLIVNPSFEGPKLPWTNRSTASFFEGWSADGTRSLALIRDSDPHHDAYASLLGMIPGGIDALKPNTQYTVMATYSLTEPFTNSPLGESAYLKQRLSIFVHLNDTDIISVQGANTPGSRTLRGTFTTPDSFEGINTIRLYVGDDSNAPHRLSWDRVGLFEGDVAADEWFTGDTPSRDGLHFEWEGEPHNSPSVAYR